MRDEEPTRRAPKGRSAIMHCVDGATLSEVAAYGCLNDCSYVALVAPLDEGAAAGIVFRIVPRDAFCAEKPLLHEVGCIIILENNQNKNKKNNIFNKLMNITYDLLIYFKNTDDGVLAIFECTEDGEMERVVKNAICSYSEGRTYFCIDIEGVDAA